MRRQPSSCQCPSARWLVNTTMCGFSQWITPPFSCACTTVVRVRARPDVVDRVVGVDVVLAIAGVDDRRLSARPTPIVVVAPDHIARAPAVDCVVAISAQQVVVHARAADERVVQPARTLVHHQMLICWPARVACHRGGGHGEYESREHRCRGHEPDRPRASRNRAGVHDGYAHTSRIVCRSSTRDRSIPNSDMRPGHARGRAAVSARVRQCH